MSVKKYLMAAAGLSVLAISSVMPVRPANAGYESERAYCREYTKNVRIDGRTQTAYGRACLQPDGDWKIVSYNGNEDLYEDMYQQVHESLNTRTRTVIVYDYPPFMYRRGHGYGHVRNHHWKHRPYYRPYGYSAYNGYSGYSSRSSGSSLSFNINIGDDDGDRHGKRDNHDRRGDNRSHHKKDRR